MSGDVCDGRCGLLGILPAGHSHSPAAPAPAQGSECPTPDCGGDPNYAAPGRGHAPSCKYPAPAQGSDELREALYNLTVDNRMWIGDDGQPLEYLPEREQRIGDYLDAVLALPAVQRLLAALRDKDQLAEAIVDLCWKATPYGGGEHVGAYLLPAGTVHRLIGVAQGAGIPASFRAALAGGQPTMPKTSPPPWISGDHATDRPGYGQRGERA